MSSTSFEYHVHTANFSVPSYATSSHILTKNNFFITVFKEEREREERGEMRSNESEREGGGGLGVLRLHFKRKNCFFLKLLLFKSIFFSNKVIYFTLQSFRAAMRNVTIQKKTKSRKKIVNPHYALGMMHDLCIMIFQ